MAVKDPKLDLQIIESARKEFLRNGYRKASLRKIAEQAGITTGALYTRYDSKDALFCSLLQDCMTSIFEGIQPLTQQYQAALQAGDPMKFLAAVQDEEEFYSEAMIRYYDECVLILCKSEGSSMEQMLEKFKADKIKEMTGYLQVLAKPDANLDGVELLIAEQFTYYRMILERGCTMEESKAGMETVKNFLDAGWHDLFQKILR